tara:strand:+ start:11943 stop:12326 length:384 start_codon:yes stop_codon:yes gene_type:complete
MNTNIKEYARQCSITSEGMNEGWIDDEAIDTQYFKYQKDVIKYIKKTLEEENANGGGLHLWDLNKSDDDILEIGYNIYGIYWTEWEEEEGLEERYNESKEETETRQIERIETEYHTLVYEITETTME